MKVGRPTIVRGVQPRISLDCSKQHTTSDQRRMDIEPVGNGPQFYANKLQTQVIKYRGVWAVIDSIYI